MQIITDIPHNNKNLSIISFDKAADCPLKSTHEDWGSTYKGVMSISSHGRDFKPPLSFNLPKSR